MKNIVLQTDNISKNFKSFCALNNVSVTLEKGTATIIKAHSINRIPHHQKPAHSFGQAFHFIANPQKNRAESFLPTLLM